MILLQLSGINGDSTIQGYTNWIGISSIQFNVARSVSNTVGSIDRDTSNPQFGEIQVSKPTDSASTQIFAQAMYGMAIGTTCTFNFLQTAGANAPLQLYMQLQLTNPIITSYSVSSSGDRPSESFTISFTQIGMLYTQFQTGSAEVKADPKGYNLTTGEPTTPTAS